MDCERGFYKTTDGGKTWERVWPLEDRGVGDFVVDPRDFDVVIAAAYKTYRRAWTYIDRQPGNHLYKSTDGGKTWKKLTEGLPVDIELGRTGLAIFEKNPNVVSPGSTRRSTSAWPSATAWPTSGRPAGSEAGASAAAAVSSPRTSPSTSSRPSRSTPRWPSRPPSSRRSSRPTRRSSSRSSTSSSPTRIS